MIQYGKFQMILLSKIAVDDILGASKNSIHKYKE